MTPLVDHCPIPNSTEAEMNAQDHYLAAEAWLRQAENHYTERPERADALITSCTALSRAHAALARVAAADWTAVVLADAT